jgi:hypothetical protein
VAPDIQSLVSYLPVPGFGVLPVNAFVIKAAQPVLVDTGLAALRQDFLQSLRSIIDPQDLRWIWLTHMDPDHVGNLQAVLDEAPNARVITTYLGMGKLGLLQLPVDRVHLLNPGQCLDVGNRQLTSIAPPCFDAPETCGFFDDRSGALFSADCFGALLSEPVQNAADIAAADLREGLVAWSTVDAPWLHMIDQFKFGEALKSVSRLNPNFVLSNHLPPAEQMTDTLLAHLAAAQDAPRFVGPDQAMLEQMMSAA